MKPAKTIISGITAAILGLSAASAQALAQYTVLDLGAVYGNSLNASGQVAGTLIDDNGLPRGFYTGANGLGTTLLNAPDGQDIVNVGINDAGQLAGTVVNSGGFFANAGSQTVTTFPYQNARMTEVTGINASGQVIGNGDGMPFISGPNGVGLQALTIGGSQDYVQVAAINASGQVLASVSNMRTDRYEVFLTGANGQNAVRVSPEGQAAAGNALNDRGDIAGEFATEDGDHHAFVTYANGGMRDLGNLGGHFNTAWGINNLGQVVGLASLPSEENPFGPTRAFIANADDQAMVDLNTLLVGFDADVLSAAYAINDRGQILVGGGIGHYYLLTEVAAPAVPEAPTNALMLLGFGALSFAVKRKARQQQAR